MADNDARARRKTTFEIPLPSIRKYVPGSGPPPPRISLVPPRDSTAYIIDQFVLPTDKDMTETSRRLIHYHVGFTDLPAAKILVPCYKVLDYVSPRELEEWEYKNLERKDEERARRLAEQQRIGAPKKKPGRKPKVFMEDTGARALSPADEALLLAQEVAGPSLSTPQGRKLNRMLDEEYAGYTSNLESDDAAIHRQLENNPVAEGMLSEGDFEADSESVDQLALEYHTPGDATPTRSASLVPPRKDSMHGTASAPGTASSIASPAPAVIYFPGKIHPAWTSAFTQPTESAGLPKAHTQNGRTLLDGAAWSVVKRQQKHKRSTSPSGSGSVLETGSGSKSPASRLSTPGQVATSSGVSYASARKRKGMTPVDVTSSARKKQRQKRQKPQKPPVEDELAEEEWEVKDLVDDGWFLEHGAKVHKYLVLWEGEWPEDQNPTWEPAENVQNRDLIERYEKRKRSGLLKPHKKTPKPLHRFPPEARYSSVAEAFEGGIDEQAAPAAAGIESDPDVPDETFLVTEDAEDITSNGVKPAPSFGTFDSLLAAYKQNFAGE